MFICHFIIYHVYLTDLICSLTETTFCAYPHKPIKIEIGHVHSGVAAVLSNRRIRPAEFQPNQLSTEYPTCMLILVSHFGKKVYAENINVNIICRGVNVNALTHVINTNILTRDFFLTQINRIVRFEPNFLPSLQRGRLSVIV